MSLARLIRGLLLAGATSTAALAQDPVQLYPGNYKVLIENDQVRVMDFMLKRGATEQLHMHPAHVLYVLTGFKIRFTFADGSTKVRETRTGDVLYSDAVMHSPLNVGDTDAHGLLIELKQPPDGRAAGAPGGGGGPSAQAAALVTALTYIHGLPGQADSLKQHLLSLSAPTRAEDGAIRYDLYQSAEHPDEFLRLEVWRDRAALETHKQSPHLKASFARRQREGWSTEITLWRRETD